MNEIIRHLIGLIRALEKFIPNFERRFRRELDK